MTNLHIGDRVRILDKSSQVEYATVKKLSKIGDLIVAELSDGCKYTEEELALSMVAPKFYIGDIVQTKVDRKSSLNSSIMPAGAIVEIIGIKREISKFKDHPSVYYYTCENSEFIYTDNELLKYTCKYK